MMGPEEEEEERVPLQGLDKAAVLQETKEFSLATVNVANCTSTLTKILFLIANGDMLTTNEATEVYFAATKLFQCDKPRLRRLVYVLLKELSGVAEQVFVASATLVKDINSNNDVYRANAIRTLHMVTDATMIGPMERYLKQAVVDKNNNVVSAALVSGLHLSAVQPEMVKRWGAEVAEALKSRGAKVQYHALALLHKIRKNDRLSVTKLVQSAQSGPVRSPLALCLLIKLCTELMQEDFAASADLYSFVTNCLRHSCELVVFEAAKSICSLKHVGAKEVLPAVLVLQLYLTAHKPTLRFAAVRLLNRVATTHPSAVSSCSIDLESLINDSNRNIATLAITTLLKMGSATGVDRLLKQISGFMHDIVDEFKVVVVDAMKVLTVKFPSKYAVMLQFLNTAFREDGNAEYKRSIVETIVSVIQSNEQARESGLMYLCEFIEDCEYNSIIQRILAVLGEYGPTCSKATKFVRFIYNRISLDFPQIRACAVSTLAKFAVSNSELRPTICSILKRTTFDEDDEVRDRAMLYYNLLKVGNDEDISNLIQGVSEAVSKERQEIRSRPAAPIAGDTAAPLPETAIGTTEEEGSEEQTKSMADVQASQFREKLRKIPELKSLGEPHKTCEPVMLTDADAEFVVTAVKHVYATRLVLQYKVQNTLDDHALRNVSISMSTDDVEAEPQFALPIDIVMPGDNNFAYVVYEIAERTFPSGSFTTSLSFTMCELNKAGEAEEDGDADEYPIEDLVINACDHIAKYSPANFETQWESMADEHSVDTYNLSALRNLTVAVAQVADFYGMTVIGGVPEKVSAKSHTLKMAGSLQLAEGQAASTMLISARVFLSVENAVTLELAIRGADEEVRQFFSEALVS